MRHGIAFLRPGMLNSRHGRANVRLGRVNLRPKRAYLRLGLAELQPEKVKFEAQGVNLLSRTYVCRQALWVISQLKTIDSYKNW